VVEIDSEGRGKAVELVSGGDRQVVFQEGFDDQVQALWREGDEGCFCGLDTVLWRR
jgi:hypothetical protein